MDSSQIQILGIRRFFSKKAQKEIAYDAFFDKKWRAPDVLTLFEHVEKYINKIPEKERYNLYYTCAQCLEEKGRKMVNQEVMPFDIDGIDLSKIDDYINIILKALGINYNETGIVYSGNGLQFIVGIKESFKTADYFSNNRRHYKAICEKINRCLENVSLPGKADTSVFSAARLMRLPGTLNCKKNKSDKMGRLIQRKIVRIDFNISKRSGIPTVEAKDQINIQNLKNYPIPDEEAILSECEFLKWCKNNQNDVNEEQWYAMLSITGRFPNGNQISHECSQEHVNYTHGETEFKIDQAMQASGPRTCSNIEKISEKCQHCPHFRKITSPILIRGKNYIKTKDNGFHDYAIDAKGNPKKGKPNFEDLRKFFEQQNKYKIIGNSKSCLIWNNQYWKIFEDNYLENFAQTHFYPPADGRMTKEFRDLICRTNIKDPEWFIESTNRKVNFKNGILNIDTMEFKNHSVDIGFRYVLPYEYDQNAKCPLFDKFMKEITGSQQELEDVLLEFAGYCISNDTCWAEKAALLVGDGANGKSTFMKVLMSLAGEENYSSISMKEVKNETARQQMDGKIFNLAEETPSYAMTESASFKNIVSGGKVTMRKLYKHGYSITNKCKLIFACYDLPKTNDTSKGYFRRLLIIPFNQIFEGTNKDSFIIQKLLTELPGIFNRVLKGYKTLKTNKKFTIKKVLINEIESYRIESDSVVAFFRDCVSLEHSKNDYCKISDMYTNYKFFTDSRAGGNVKDKSETYNVFARRMAKLIPDYKIRHKRKIFEGKRESVLFGVKFSELTDY